MKQISSQNQPNRPTPQAALTEKDAARYIGMSVPFLRASRCNGNRENHTPAPPHIKIGRAVRYKVADLDNWLDDHRVDL